MVLAETPWIKGWKQDDLNSAGGNLQIWEISQNYIATSSLCVIWVVQFLGTPAKEN